MSETTTMRQDLWELAAVVAMERLGIVPPRRVDGKCQPLASDLARMNPDDARRAKRKFRKLWRRDLAKDLKRFERCPKRHRETEYGHSGSYVKGRWTSKADPLECMFIKLQAVELGSRPSAYARAARWTRLKDSQPFCKMLLKVAAEFGLLHPKRSM